MQGSGGRIVGEGDLLLAQVPDDIPGIGLMPGVSAAAGPLSAPIASQPRPGSASRATSLAASGRRAHATVRLCPASTANQRPGLLALPHPRRLGILPVLCRYPPVESEAQATARRAARAAARSFSPRCQPAAAVQEAVRQPGR